MEITLSGVPHDTKILKIPEYVTRIGWNACNGNELREVVFSPDGKLKKICQEAFQSCDQLRSITLPDGLRSIETFAFRYCSNLEKITIPASVTNIGYRAFMLCPKLTIRTPKGSYTEEYAKKYKIPVEYIEEVK